jgi:hypothetical protein
MKKLIFIALLMLAAKFGFSQYSTITYYHFKSKIKRSSVSVGDTIVIAKKQPVFTGQYLKTENGIHPIMMSPNGKLYIERISKKTGNIYRQYLN